MQKTLVAQRIPSVCPNRCHSPINVVKFSQLQRPSYALRLKSSKWGLDAQRRKQLITSSLSSRSRVVCLFDGIGQLFGENAKDAARKAYDKAVEGARRAFSEWKEASRKRKAAMGRNDEDGLGGGGRYYGGGGGGGGGGGAGDPEDVEEYDDGWNTFLAFAVFIYLYMRMRGTRWTRCHTPYTDFDAIRLWLWRLIVEIYCSDEWDFAEDCIKYVQMYLDMLRCKSLGREAELIISRHRSQKAALSKSTK